MSDPWTIAAAAGTAASAVFVAWQAFETRRATNTSREALLAGQAIAAESMRSRLDQRAPQVEVCMEDVSWPPWEFGNGIRDVAQVAVDSRRYQFPQDFSIELMVCAPVRVKNVGSQTVHLSFTGTIRVADDPIESRQKGNPRTASPRLLQPGAEAEYRLEESWPLATWTAHRDPHEKGSQLRHFPHASVVAHDDADNGVIDTWGLWLYAWPIMPVSKSPEREWRITERHRGKQIPVEYDIQPPRERSYWISRSKGIRLPDPGSGTRLHTGLPTQRAKR